MAKKTEDAPKCPEDCLRWDYDRAYTEKYHRFLEGVSAGTNQVASWLRNRAGQEWAKPKGVAGRDTSKAELLRALADEIDALGTADGAAASNYFDVNLRALHESED